MNRDHNRSRKTKHEMDDDEDDLIITVVDFVIKRPSYLFRARTVTRYAGGTAVVQPVQRYSRLYPLS